MVQTSFSFRIGNFECLAVRDTIDEMNLEFLFPSVKKSDFSDLAQKYNLPLSEIFEITSLLVKTGQHTVLLDTGNAVGWKPGAGLLVQNLEAAGVSPKDIDTVIISHCHPDHIGGNAISQSQATFPSARYFIHQNEWDFWTSNPELKSFPEFMRVEMLACIQKNVTSIKDKFTTVKSGVDIIPGFQYILVPGHTPGHAAVSITSGSERLIYLGDTCHTIAQVVRPEWCSIPDLDTAQSVNSRKQILGRVQSDHTLCFFAHFAFPPIGHIIKKENLFFWQPSIPSQ